MTSAKALALYYNTRKDDETIWQNFESTNLKIHPHTKMIDLLFCEKWSQYKN
jgi:hypothetical protein